jgi:hypothetical protein
METIKTVSFNKTDQKLIKQIENYQKSHNHKSFISAVRELCSDALTLKNIVK